MLANCISVLLCSTAINTSELNKADGYRHLISSWPGIPFLWDAQPLCLKQSPCDKHLKGNGQTIVERAKLLFTRLLISLLALPCVGMAVVVESVIWSLEWDIVFRTVSSSRPDQTERPPSAFFRTKAAAIPPLPCRVTVLW